MEYEIITRAEAKEQGLTYYFTGKPCKRGHLSKRQTSNGSCQSCVSQWKLLNTDKVSKSKQTYATKHKAKCASSKLAYILNNPLRVKASKSKWKANNKSKLLAATRLRQIRKIRATPSWITKTQLKAIELIYSSCPEGYHVDHIIPLNNPLVCGLHVPWNLQHLPANENMKKGNKVIQHLALAYPIRLS